MSAGFVFMVLVKLSVSQVGKRWKWNKFGPIDQADTRAMQDSRACDTRKGKTKRSLFIKRVPHARVLIFYNTLVTPLGKQLYIFTICSFRCWSSDNP